MRLLQWLELLSLSVASNAAALASASSTPSAPPAQSTACGSIVNNADTYIFNASLAYECLTSVPFNAAVATRFLQYYNDTLQFQSTLAYLKNPPASYQQPAVDLLGGLNQLQQAINDGKFANQYEFEAALQTLIYAAHDGHVGLDAGILAAFSFASPYDIVSLSIDGMQVPKVYLAEDLFDSTYFTTFQPSAIKTINGVDAVTYLTDFAAINSAGTLEPHADWNQLMLSAAQDIQGDFNVFSGGATFYPGDTITFVLENGTTINDFYLAIYNSPGDTGPLETGGDFYNFFVLGFYPASFDPNEDDTEDDSAATSAVTSPTSTPAVTSSAVTSASTPTVSSWENEAYPDVPDVWQADLGVVGEGYISGYFLNSTSVSVLSIPSFDENSDAVLDFQNTIGDFINQSQRKGLQKIVIDLQQNLGGQPLLAIDTFKQFFPNIDPFAGSRLRAHDSANIMGETVTDYFNSLNTTSEDYYILAANEWVATDRLNANTGNNFTSWTEEFGPVSEDGDQFTVTQRYNISSTVFDSSGSDPDGIGLNFTISGTNANPAKSATPPYSADNIIILSDGICVSSCALFMEMMHHEAGVRVVAVGGKPITGPMQAPSGSRGARDYDTDSLDANINFVQEILANQSSPKVNFLPNRTEALDVFVTYADINLRDQIRKNDSIPLQFAYEAADCRVFYTPQTVYNYTALWQYAANAIWTNPSLCVSGSTGFATTGTNTTNFVGPSTSSTPVPPTNLTAYLSNLNASSSSILSLADGLPDAGANPRNAAVTKIKTCTTNADCKGRNFCHSVPTCSGGPTVQQCVSSCTRAGAPCGDASTCQAQSEVIGKVGSQDLTQNFCPPAAALKPCGNKVTTVGEVVVHNKRDLERRLIELT